MTSCYLNYLFKGLVSKHSHILMHLRVKFQHRNFREDTIQPLTMGPHLFQADREGMFSFRASLQNYKLKKIELWYTPSPLHPQSFLHYVVTIFFVLIRLCASLFFLYHQYSLSKKESDINHLYSGAILSQGNSHIMSSA